MLQVNIFDTVYYTKDRTSTQIISTLNNYSKLQLGSNLRRLSQNNIISYWTPFSP